ncbi:MAG: thiol oxidoreductase [Planctomycetes bacterium]|nr:thiol oxidoreductase [Planctomycetota bacterium]
MLLRPRVAPLLVSLLLGTGLAPTLLAQDRLGPLGGGGTVVDASRDAFGFPSPLLAASERRAFAVGNALFRANWVAAPASAKGLDGLGPLFNARSCSSCHARDGRSRPPEHDGDERHGLLVRIGVRVPGEPDRDHPRYGGQIQDDAIAGVQAELQVAIDWLPSPGRYGDGEPFELLAPRYRLHEPADGPLGDDVVLGGRVAPQLIGLGLLEAIPDAALEALADPDDRDGDGVSGRVHRLGTGPEAPIGRCGWKATQPTVHAQTAGAFVHDMGITSPEQPVEPMPATQRARVPAQNGGEPEIDAAKLGRVVFYTRTLAVPAQREADDPDVRRGHALFRSFGCAACHTETFVTGPVAFHDRFGGQTIHPFTDLLLHDLGEALADEKRDGDARPAEWRTAPLWGLGLITTVSGHDRLLHDGRARGLAEAILWHGGEALAARERFRLAPADERRQLLAFLRSL